MSRRHRRPGRNDLTPHGTPGHTCHSCRQERRAQARLMVALLGVLVLTLLALNSVTSFLGAWVAETGNQFRLWAQQLADTEQGSQED